MSARPSLTACLAACLLALAGSAAAETGTPDPDMRKVLEALDALGPKPIETLSPDEARKQPGAADAVKKVIADDKLTVDPRAGLTVTNSRFADMGSLRLRYYTPEEATKTSNLPVILFFRGGGWVIGNLDSYDASAAALARKAGAAVVSADYPMGPEQRFPAAHNQAVEAYKYLLQHAQSWGYDPSRVAIAGESAGGNLAVATAMAARDQNLTQPVAVVSVYPLAQTGVDTPSMRDEADAKPLSKAAVGWFLANSTDGAGDLSDPRLNLVGADLRGLPPVTIINAEIDPLRSDGELLANRIRQAGGEVVHKLYPGVTHEFFGMAPVVAKAADAQDFAVARLKEGFAHPANVVAPPKPPEK